MMIYLTGILEEIEEDSGKVNLQLVRKRYIKQHMMYLLDYAN